MQRLATNSILCVPLSVMLVCLCACQPDANAASAAQSKENTGNTFFVVTTDRTSGCATTGLADRLQVITRHQQGAGPNHFTEQHALASSQLGEVAVAVSPDGALDSSSFAERLAPLQVSVQAMPSQWSAWALWGMLLAYDSPQEGKAVFKQFEVENRGEDQRQVENLREKAGLRIAIAYETMRVNTYGQIYPNRETGDATVDMAQFRELVRWIVRTLQSPLSMHELISVAEQTRFKTQGWLTLPLSRVPGLQSQENAEHLINELAKGDPADGIKAIESYHARQGIRGYRRQLGSSRFSTLSKIKRLQALELDHTTLTHSLEFLFWHHDLVRALTGESAANVELIRQAVKMKPKGFRTDEAERRPHTDSGLVPNTYFFTTGVVPKGPPTEFFGTHAGITLTQEELVIFNEEVLHAAPDTDAERLVMFTFVPRVQHL